MCGINFCSFNACKERKFQQPYLEELQTLPNKYQWIFFGKTPIEQVQHEDLNVWSLPLDFMLLNRIHEYLIPILFCLLCLESKLDGGMTPLFK